MGGQTYLVDVAIVHPTAPSNVVEAAQSLSTAKKRAKVKTRQYNEMCRQQNAIFVPFVLETYGGFGPQAVHFLKDVADFSHQHVGLDREEVIVDLKTSIAVAVQNGNSSIISRGLQDSVRNIRTITSRFS
jgi:hypothetical protein